VKIALRLTPSCRLVVDQDADDASAVDSIVASRIVAAFKRGPGHGLLCLGAGEVATVLPPEFAYFRNFAARYMAIICGSTGSAADQNSNIACPPLGELTSIVLSVPPLRGGEYLNPEGLARIWADLDAAFRYEQKDSGLDLPAFLKSKNPAWNLVGRVYFNLAENRKDADHPFAFMATYTTKLSAQGKPQHLPLGQALREYAGAKNRARLLSLLLPVQQAAEVCAWCKAMVDSQSIFEPNAWSVNEALRLLRDVPALEKAGIVLRMPANWRGNRPSRPSVSATVGGAAPTKLGQDALLDFRMEITLDGERLGQDEMKRLLAQSDELVLVRGKWVEIDRRLFQHALENFAQVEKLATSGHLTFAAAMRLLAGANITGNEKTTDDAQDWGRVAAGPWLAETLRSLRGPDGLAQVDPGPALRGTLRPYQQIGVRWLYLLCQLGMGACLADDMGLGKTIQVLSLLLIRKAKRAGKFHPSLIVAPASLLGNWAQEFERFAPDLNVLIAHPSFLPPSAFPDGMKIRPVQLAKYDVVVTTYGSIQRHEWTTDCDWDLVVLDEAQAIKNPNAQQTKAVKKLKANARFALTGTPVENRLGDLWSIFDFTNPGLLGTGKAFTAYAKQLAKRPDNAYGPLRELVRPYILRRLKTDRTIITDLPDKTELRSYCLLSRKQAALYQQAVTAFREKLQEVQGIARKGLVFQFLMRFKQICNHPSHWLGEGDWAPEQSGKFDRLKEIAEIAVEKQEKILVFSQFREVAAPLSAFLATVFGRTGLVLHGDTPIPKRRELVTRFQEDESVPFFVLSLKAGGSGLNLTAASHVVHFDRWWNPAVENQATDRAYRIGQRKNVLVHKFICRGTIEEKIDTLIEGKRKLAQDLLEGTGEINLTEMKDEDLLALVQLDLNTASEGM